MADIKVKDLPITTTPALEDYTINDLAAGTQTQKVTWQKIKDLLQAGSFSARIDANVS